MYKLLLLLFVIGILALALEYISRLEKKLEYQLNNSIFETLEILVTADDEIGTYTTKEGDTLIKVSQTLNTSLKSLIKLNDIKNINLIYPNIELIYIKRF